MLCDYQVDAKASGVVKHIFTVLYLKLASKCITNKVLQFYILWRHARAANFHAARHLAELSVGRSEKRDRFVEIVHRPEGRARFRQRPSSVESESVSDISAISSSFKPPEFDFDKSSRCLLAALV